MPNEHSNTPSPGQRPQTIPLSQIHDLPGVFNPKPVESKLGSMILSIQNNGVMEPVILRDRGDGQYQLLSGYRRRVASERAGKKDIPAFVYEMTMQEARISDTIVYGLARMMNSYSKELSAVGMLLQNIINFFITGSSSQAAITMPIMAPVADIVGLSRQTAVLSYCFGDGFSDMFWPTACSLECGLMGISLNKWYRFIAPLFALMVALQILFVVISVYVY